MKSWLPLYLILFMISNFWGCDASHGPTPPSKPPTGIAGDGSLDQIVGYIRARHQVPALAGIMVLHDRIIEKSAIGKRSINSSIPVTVNDQWHIGSITKSMTATLAALLVKQGVIAWDSTIADIYPDLIGIMRPEYQDVRLDELLSHTSGLPDRLFDIPGSNAYYRDRRPLDIQRRELAETVLQIETSTNHGECHYSNIGYIVAGAMLEEVTGIDWETLMQTYLFDPLNMSSSGFGAPDAHGSVMQPMGHHWVESSWMSTDPQAGQIADNAPILGPAGTIHVSLDDMAAYMKMHLLGLQGQSVPGFLSAQEFAKLYQPFPDSSYALGWVTDTGMIYHDGSNTFWYGLLMIDAQKDLALFAVTNAADLENGFSDSTAINAVVELLHELEQRADAIPAR